MRVEVYWNLHLSCWSVRHKDKVISHVPSISLRDVYWVVQPAGREKVRREKRKNVHAFARGTFGCSTTYYPIHAYPEQNTNWQEVTYNPYHDENFVRLVYDGDGVSRVPISQSAGALLSLESGKPKVWARVGDE